MNTQTQTRLLRGTVTPEATQAKDELVSKVNEYAKLSLEYEEQEKLFKDQTKATKARLDILKAELTETAKEMDQTVLVGDQATLEFTGRNSRSIKPEDLYVYFRKLGDSLKFFKYVKVALGDLEKDLNKAVVEASGLVNNDFNAHSGIKVKPKLHA